jgi:hypothetical protein
MPLSMLVNVQPVYLFPFYLRVSLPEIASLSKLLMPFIHHYQSLDITKYQTTLRQVTDNTISAVLSSFFKK